MQEKDVLDAVVSELRKHTDAELVPDQLDLDLSLDLLGIELNRSRPNFVSARTEVVT